MVWYLRFHPQYDVVKRHCEAGYDMIFPNLDLITYANIKKKQHYSNRFHGLKLFSKYVQKFYSTTTRMLFIHNLPIQIQERVMCEVLMFF